MITLAAVTLSLLPWTGQSLPTVSSEAAQYRLVVRGAASQIVNLRADVDAKGWIAAFCTGRLCSPERYDLQLDKRGTGAVEFEIVRDDPSAPHHARVTLAATGAPHTLIVTVNR